jgi:hypothetical protein
MGNLYTSCTYCNLLQQEHGARCTNFEQHHTYEYVKAGYLLGGDTPLFKPETRDYRRRKWPHSCVHTVMMVFSAQLAEGGGASPPLSTRVTSPPPPPARLARYSYLSSPISLNKLKQGYWADPYRNGTAIRITPAEVNVRLPSASGTLRSTLAL